MFSKDNDFCNATNLFCIFFFMRFIYGCIQGISFNPLIAAVLNRGCLKSTQMTQIILKYADLKITYF